MNRIVREHYPVASLPEDLREGLPADTDVRVIIEAVPFGPETVPSLDELFALRKAPFRTTDQIVEDIRRQRDEWDD